MHRNLQNINFCPLTGGNECCGFPQGRNNRNSLSSGLLCDCLTSSVCTEWSRSFGSLSDHSRPIWFLDVFKYFYLSVWYFNLTGVLVWQRPYIVMLAHNNFPAFNWVMTNLITSVIQLPPSNECSQSDFLLLSLLIFHFYVWNYWVKCTFIITCWLTDVKGVVAV